MMPLYRSIRLGRGGMLALLALALAGPASAQPATRQPPRPAAQSSAAIDIPNIPYVRHVLPNGLVTLLSEDHSAPVASVSIWYHVGSKNEKVGRTGFAHLFEHMMFEGSENVAGGQHRLTIQSVGGTFNGTTNTDRTNYFETVPSNHLETVLWLEADRMGFLLPRMTQERLDAQRDIVKNERRLRVDNQPFGTASEVLSHAIFPESNPYSWSVIGSMVDLSAASMDDVQSFFRTYYAPNNAVIAISGDIDIPRTKALLDRYFAGIPAGPKIIRPKMAATTLAAEKRLVLEDTRVRLPQIQFAWPTVGGDHLDRFALAALASTLSLDRTSRLRKLLVYDRELATNVGTFNSEMENAGMFRIFVTPRPTASLTEIERLVDSVVADVKTAPLTAKEVQRFKNYFAVSTITGLQFTLAKADLLAQGEVYNGDPKAYVNELKMYQSVTPVDVQRVAKKYLTSGRVVLNMVPAGKLDLISRPELKYTNVTPAPVTSN